MGDLHLRSNDQVTFEIAVNEFSLEFKMQVLCQTTLLMARMATRAPQKQPCPLLGNKVVDKIERNNREIEEGSDGITSSENEEILRRRSLYIIR